ILGHSKRSESVGWRKNSRGGWLDRLNSKASDLAGLVAGGTTGQGVLDCLAELRNLIHREVLRESEHRSGGESEFFLELPETPRVRDGHPNTVRQLVHDAAERAGGAEQWGIWRDERGRIYAAADIYIEQV